MKTVRFYVDGQPYAAVEIPDDQTAIEEDGERIEVDAPPIEIGGKQYELRTEVPA